MNDIANISKEFTIQTQPFQGRDGFVGLWAAPGLPMSIVRDQDDNPSWFATKSQALLSATEAMFDALNSPRARAAKSGKPERYRKMTGPEFAVALRRAGIMPSFFAYIYGTDPARVLTWIDGSMDVPHPARILLQTFYEHPRSIDTAEATTEAVTTERKPSRKD